MILLENSLGTEKVPQRTFCDKDFAAELSGELSGAICLSKPCLLGSAVKLFRKFFGAVRAILWLWGSFLALELNAREFRESIKGNDARFGETCAVQYCTGNFSAPILD